MPPKFKREYDRAPERQALLDGNSDDDDFFLRGPNAQPGRLGGPRAQDPKINRLQGQVDEVIDVMQDNIHRVVDRGERLEDLQDKSDDLSANADVFRMRAGTLKQRMWWRECKMRVLLASVIIVILLIIIIPIVVKIHNSN